MCTSPQGIKAHGVEWHSDPIDAGDGYLMTYGRDPFGNVIEIQQVPNEYAFAQLRESELLRLRIKPLTPQSFLQWIPK